MSALPPLNWIDWLLIAGGVFFLLEGWKAGFIQLISGFIAYAGAIWLSIRYHDDIGTLITKYLGSPILWSNIIGYILIAFGAQIVIGQVLLQILKRMGRKIIGSRFDNVFGSLLSLVNFSLIMAFLFVVLLAVPIPGRYKKDIGSSAIASRLVFLTEKYGGAVKSSLKEVTDEAIQFITVRPQSKEIIQLNIQPQAWELSVDEQSERQMLELINNERIKAGAVPLTSDAALVGIAREYSRDMLLRKYFSHYDPDGNDLKHRLSSNTITYQTAGENLAYAPDVAVAMKGLLESEGHKRNIVDPTFVKSGIGVIDAGAYGKMFTQIFISLPYYFYNSK